MADNWQLKAVLSAVDNLSPVLKGINGAARTTRKYLSDVGKSAGKLSSQIGMPFALLSGVVGGLSIGALRNAVVGFTDLGESVYKGAMRAGMSVEEYQRMKYVAEQAGVGVEMLEGSMAKLNAQTAKAAAGQNKNLAGLYQRLGISMRDSNGQVRSALDLLPELADAFQRNKNPAVQARMGVALYGRAWAEMAPLLMEGSEGIAMSLERLKRLKGVLAPEDIKGAKALGDQFKDLNIVTKGFQNTIANALVPVLGPLIEDIVQWAAANRKVVAAGVKEFITDLVASLRTVDWQVVIRGAKDFAKSLGGLVDFLGGTKNALIALVVFMNIQTLIAIGGLIAALGRLGLAFFAMGLRALASVAPLQLATAGMRGATLSAAVMISTLGKLSAAIGVTGAAWAGWQIGTQLNDYVINPAVGKLSGNKDASLGTWIYDKMHPEEAGMFGKQSLLPNQQAKVGGEIKVTFKDAPPGMRVEQAAAGPVAINTDVGYRFDAWSGAAY